MTDPILEQIGDIKEYGVELNERQEEYVRGALLILYYKGKQEGLKEAINSLKK